MDDNPLTADALERLCAADVMSDQLITVRADESLLSAWELLNRGRFRHLPVIAADGRCIALLDDVTVISMLSTNNVLNRLRVADAMPDRVHCVSPDKSLIEIARILCRERSTAVPVVDDRLRLVGIVTDVDLVRVLSRLALPARVSAAG